MKTCMLCLVCASISNGVSSDLESIRSIVKLGDDAKGAFVSTNRTSMPFHLIAKDLDLPTLVGAKQDTNVINSSRMALITQFVPSLKLVKGNVASTGYIRVSGRYALLEGRILTLTDFEMDISDDEGSRDEVLSVHQNSLTLQVSPVLAAEAEKLIQKNQNHKSDLR